MLNLTLLAPDILYSIINDIPNNSSLDAAADAKFKIITSGESIPLDLFPYTVRLCRVYTAGSDLNVY